MDRQRIEAYVDAAAAALDLPLAPAHRPGVLAYFALAAELAESVLAMPLGRADDPAPVFVPIGPREGHAEGGASPADASPGSPSQRGAPSRDASRAGASSR